MTVIQKRKGGRKERNRQYVTLTEQTGREVESQISGPQPLL